jgi:multiple RNA-binding domain-containing protein 1
VASSSRLVCTYKLTDQHPHLPPNEKIIMQHRRLYVRNLAHVTTKDELADEFARFGEVEEAYIPVAKEKGTHKGTALGYGFILYKNAEHALAAYRRMDQTTFQGRIIHVLPAGPKYGKQPEVEGEAAQEGEGAALNTEVLGKVKQGHAEVKKKKEKQATLADKHGVNWATMYMDVSLVLSVSSYSANIIGSTYAHTSPTHTSTHA